MTTIVSTHRVVWSFATAENLKDKLKELEKPNEKLAVLEHEDELLRLRIGKLEAWRRIHESRG